MNILLNGKAEEITPGLTVERLVASKGFTGAKIAVAIGTKVIPRQEWQVTPLQEGDKVTIISAYRGG